MTDTAVNRRRFMQVFGLALPTLASLRPARAQVEPTPRFVVFFETGGTINNRSTAAQFDRLHPWNDWIPTSAPGAPLTLGPLHGALNAHRDRLLFLSGIDNKAEPLEHTRADLSTLTARRIEVVGKDHHATGPSIDQVLAERLSAARPVPFRSVDFVAPGPHYGEPSHRAARQPISREADPRVAFNRLFAQLHPELDPAALARLRTHQRSVLDGALGGFRALNAQLSAADRIALEAHQDRIRAVETRLDLLDAIELGPQCARPDIGAAAHLPSVARWPKEARQIVAPLLVDLMVHALTCGLTHVATMHYPDTIEPFLPLPYEAISPQTNGHALGHSALSLGDPNGDAARAWRSEMQANRQFKISLVARLIDQLANLADATGPMLDNTLILHISEFSNAAVHDARDLPVMLAGNVGGRLRMGRHVMLSEGGHGNTLDSHINYQSQTSTHNLHTSILQTFGHEDEHFGDDTSVFRGPLSLA